MPTRPTLTLLAAMALLIGACANGDDDDTASVAEPGAITIIDPLASTIAPPVLDGSLPPVDSINAAPLFADAFDDLGVELTNRGGLIDRTDGRYQKSATGTHYALYVEPTGEYSVDDFVAGLVDLTRATAPFLFERYPDLESYDICQEPNDVDDASQYPPPITQIEFTREQIESVDDWDAFDLDALFALRDSGGRVSLSETVAAHPDLAPYR